MAEQTVAAARAKVVSDESFTSEMAGVDNMDSRRYSGKKAIVVGAGPAGATAAAFLSKHGFTVDVYDSQEDPLKETNPKEQVNGIGIRAVAAAVLKDAGVDLPNEGNRNGVWRLKGSAIMTAEEIKFLPELRGAGPLQYFGQGDLVVEVILEDVRKKHPEQITFFYDHRCTAIEFDNKRLILEDKEGGVITKGYDLLIAADGIHSVIRQKLQERDSTFKVKTFGNEQAYKIVQNVPDLDDQKKMVEGLREGWVILTGSAIFRELTAKFGPRTLIAFYPPSKDSIFDVFVTARPETFQNMKDREYEWVKQWIPNFFSKEWAEEFSAKLATAPLLTFSDVYLVSSFAGPATILIGDAAHCATPYGGLGANLAITDSTFLYEALESADGDIDAVPQIFDDLRFERVMTHQWHPMPFPENWRWFVGWVHLSVVASLRRFLPKLITADMNVAILEGKISPEEAMRLMKRDAVVVAVILASVVALPLAYLFGHGA